MAESRQERCLARGERVRDKFFEYLRKFYEMNKENGIQKRKQKVTNVECELKLIY